MTKPSSRQGGPSLLTDKIKVEALRLLLHDSPHPGYIKDRFGCYIVVNPAACSVFFLRPFDVEGRYDYEFLEEPALAMVREADNAVLRSGQHASITTTLFTPAYNTDRLWMISRWPLRETDGRVVGIMCAGREITGRDAGMETEAGVEVVEVRIGSTLATMQEQVEAMSAEMNRIEATLPPADASFASVRKSLGSLALGIKAILRASRPRNKRH